MHRPVTHTIFLFIVTAFCFSHPVLSQQLRWEFRNFTTNDGLPSSEVHQVLSDSRNFIWFATDHGVCRYDGYRFETFNLPDNSILSMYEDSRNRVWFVSFSGRLFYYEKGKMLSYKYNDRILKAIAQSVINNIYVDSTENVYFASQSSGSFKINAQGETLSLSKPKQQSVVEIIETDNGDYFTYITPEAVTNVGAFPVKEVRKSGLIKKKNSEINVNLPHHLLSGKSGAKKLSDESLLFYTHIIILNVFRDKSYTLDTVANPILDIEEINDGRLLIATKGDGLIILNRDNKIKDNYFPGLTVTSIEKDYEGGLWVSTTQEGAFYLSSLQMKNLTNGKAAFHEKITCLAIENDSTIWAGTEKDQLLYFKPEKRLHLINLPVNHILGIDTDLQPGDILVSVGEILRAPFIVNVSRFNENKLIAIQNLSGLIKVKAEFFTGAVSGLYKVNFEKPILEIQNSEVFRVSKLYNDSKGYILVGNLFGLWYFRDGKLVPYDSTKKILGSRITDINEFKGQFLCLGTRGNGFLIQIKDSLHQLTTANGLASENIRKIFFDDDIIWLATNKGISRLAVQSLEPFTYKITNISVQDGLPSNEVNDIRKLDSNIIVATNSGITFFHQDLFSGLKNLPLSFYLTGVRINGIDTGIRKSYKLNYLQRNLYLSFVALSYRQSSGIEYRYRLNGIDSNWAYTEAREIQLNPLPYGKFTVEIQARRKGEDWMKANSLSVQINCSPPFWKTFWFIAGSFLLIAFLLLVFFIKRTNKIRHREKDKTLVNKKLAEMEMKALRAQMNPHFIFNVLNSIHYYISHNDTEMAQYYLSKFAKLIRMTLDNSKTTFISLADELSLLRLYIDLEKIRFEGRFEYEIKVADDIAVNAVRIPNMLIQPYVENSIKHGFKIEKDDAFIDISISRSNGKIICIIEDNGIGRDMAASLSATPGKEYQSTGMEIVNDKIAALRTYYNYDLSSEITDIKDEKGNSLGTRVKLIFPDKFEIT